MLILSAGPTGTLDGEFSSCNCAQTRQEVSSHFTLFGPLPEINATTHPVHFSADPQPQPQPQPRTFQKLLTCHWEGGAALPFSWTSGVVAASPASCWDNRKNLQLHLKPLIRYHKHLYAYNVAGKQQTDGSRETVTHFPHDPSEKWYPDENGSY